MHRLILVDDNDAARLVTRALVKRTIPEAEVKAYALASAALQEIMNRGADLLITNCQMLIA